MELKGRDPMNDYGIAFTITRIKWRSILETMDDCHAVDIVGQKNWTGLHRNDGTGPEDADSCEKLATAIEQQIEAVPESDSEYTRTFIQFLRNCRGFKVY